MYVYTCGYICVYKMVPAGFFLGTFDLQADTCNSAYTEEGEIFYHDPCGHKDQWDLDSGCIQMQMDAHERIVQPFSWHLLARSPALQLSALAKDHSSWWQWELVAVPSLSVDLPGWLVSIQRSDWRGWWRCSFMVTVTALWPVLCWAFGWGPRGFRCLSFYLLNLSRKNNISKLGFSCIVSLYKYRVYTHTDTHTYTNTNPQTQLDVCSIG